MLRYQPFDLCKRCIIYNRKPLPNMKFLILLTIVTLISSACEKEQPEPSSSNYNNYFQLHIITIQGKLVNSLTHDPIPNQKLETGPGIQMHSYATTDSAGNFTLESKWFWGQKYSVPKTTVFTIIFTKSQNHVIKTINLHHFNAGDTLRDIVIETPPDYDAGSTPSAQAGELVK